ncbi:hypothetical protein FOZ62_003004 [Perkinsus olseni]|uniref:DNA replication complex GINS protein PSF3 n=2 Tax=Perkinsus olseni TaxID=32597 RepID=A0A7J6SNT1_PEROL|nr:hypothetical protein FOZ62_003004 [Perkinsus olseni]
MPYGITIKQFVVSTSMAFSSLLMGSIVVHAIMQPSLQQPDFTDEVEARQRAIRRGVGLVMRDDKETSVVVAPPMSSAQDVFSEDPHYPSAGSFPTTQGSAGSKYSRKDYWDLDQILQDEQLIDTRLVDTAYGLGWMNSQAAEVESYQRRREDEDPEGEGDENMSQAENRPVGGQSGDEGSANHLPADCKLSLPLWIAEGLYLRRFVEIEEVPSIFNANMQGLMTLEATVMRLDQKSFYYFEIGMRLAALLGLHTLMERLLKGMFERSRNIFDVAQTQIVGADQEKRMQVLMDFMTRSEREIFQQGVMVAGEYDLFRSGQLSRVRQSAVHIAPRRD